MLKLKRVERDRHIQILIRDQGHLLTRSFLTALALALGIHLLALMLFHVAPIKLRFEGTLLPPIQVESDLAVAQEPESTVIANVDRDLVPLGFYLEPRQSIPVLPKPPKSLLISHMDYIMEDGIRSNPFIQLDNDLLWSSDFSILEVSRDLPDPIVLSLTGPLAEKKLIDNGVYEDFLEKVPTSVRGQFRSIYAVQVKDDVGHVFWIEPKQLAGLDSLDKLAEQILFRMKFLPNAETFVSAGEVEIAFNLERVYKP